jgi:inorganic pyrophosphatase
MPNLAKLATFEKKLIRVVIETPRGAAVKLSYDAEHHLFEYSHPLPAGITYPYDWGFIPSTMGEDGDPLDGMVIHRAATAPGVVIKCQLMGSLKVEQTEKGETVRNDRFFFCPVKKDAQDAEMADGKLGKGLEEEIEQFLLASVINSGKKLKFKGWQKPKEALAAIRKGGKLFAREAGKKK